jgi:glyoxylase-like metal-dependent hydrolase (beta-lactamase superfamily II)
MLKQAADGVWVRQSEWVWSNAIVVRGEGGLILVDPGIDGSDLNQLADDVDRLGIPVVAGFSTRSSSRTVASCSPATCSPTS